MGVDRLSFSVAADGGLDYVCGTFVRKGAHAKSPGRARSPTTTDIVMGDSEGQSDDKRLGSPMIAFK